MECLGTTSASAKFMAGSVTFKVKLKFKLDKSQSVVDPLIKIPTARYQYDSHPVNRRGSSCR